MQFGRGYVYPENGVIHDVEFVFDGDKLTASCTCSSCTGGRVCRHIERYLSESPICEVVGKYPMVVEQIRRVTYKFHVSKD